MEYVAAIVNTCDFAGINLGRRRKRSMHLLLNASSRSWGTCFLQVDLYVLAVILGFQGMRDSRLTNANGWLFTTQFIRLRNLRQCLNSEMLT